MPSAKSTKKPDKEATIKSILADRRKALDGIANDMNRMSARLRQLQNKIIQGGVLTAEEQKEKDTLSESTKNLVSVENHAILFSITLLDDSVGVKLLAKQIKAATKELDKIKQRVENISKTIKQAGDFLKVVTGALNSMTGLLKFLV